MNKGFTLAELLIALAILGIIAVFTVPKVLGSSDNGKRNAMAKETIATIAQAFQMLQRDNNLRTNSAMSSFLPYLNYVSIDTSGTIDGTVGQSTFTCSAALPCVNLHNGTRLGFNNCSFTAIDSTHAIGFMVDTDNITTSDTFGQTKSVSIFILGDGRIVDWANLPAGTTYCATAYGPAPSSTPSWFKW